MNVKTFLEWAMIAVVVLSVFVWMAYTNPARAQDYGYGDYGGYYGDGDPEFYSDIQNQPDMIIYRDRGYGRYRRQEPEYYSDIENPPQMIIYRGRRFTTH